MKPVIGGGSEEGTCAMGCYEPRPVWTSRAPCALPHASAAAPAAGVAAAAAFLDIAGPLP